MNYICYLQRFDTISSFLVQNIYFLSSLERKEEFQHIHGEFWRVKKEKKLISFEILKVNRSLKSV
jgi:hypothetical protein